MGERLVCTVFTALGIPKSMVFTVSSCRISEWRLEACRYHLPLTTSSSVNLPNTQSLNILCYNLPVLVFLLVRLSYSKEVLISRAKTPDRPPSALRNHTQDHHLWLHPRTRLQPKPQNQSIICHPWSLSTLQLQVLLCSTD